MKPNPKTCACNGACKGDNRCKSCTCETLVSDDKRPIKVTPLDELMEQEEYLSISG